ncbi:MAG: NBR1-Ig-like domain-containing protein [Anaerolineae bacterium]
MPQGKPNQEAVVEVILTTPAIPGIHQSYWRMRNPQGSLLAPLWG